MICFIPQIVNLDFFFLEIDIENKIWSRVTTDLFKDENFIFESLYGICREIFLELVAEVQILISTLSG